jgi:hypothetical protein
VVVPTPTPVPAPTPNRAPEDELPAAARQGLRDKLIKYGVPAALVTAVIAAAVVAIADPEPISKAVAAIVTLLGISTVAATIIVIMIRNAYGSSRNGNEA